MVRLECMDESREGKSGSVMNLGQENSDTPSLEEAGKSPMRV